MWWFHGYEITEGDRSFLIAQAIILNKPDNEQRRHSHSLGPPWNPLEAELLQDGDALFLARLCCLCGSLSENRSSEETAELSVDGLGTQQVLTCLKILPGTRQF